MKPILFSTPMVQAILNGRKSMTRRVIKPTEKWVKSFDLPKCKYQPGDILWVRETWAPPLNDFGSYIYRATCWDMDKKVKWHPSIFMPKSAARIWLRVTDVRCERVQEITDEDAIKEGCAGAVCDCLHFGRGVHGCESCMNTGWQEPPTLEFMELWDSLNAKRGYSWASNPWVFVISFERCEKQQEEN